MGSAAHTFTSPGNRPLNIALWVAQGLLALTFGFAGLPKLTTPIAQLAQQAPWVADLPWLVRFIGISEVLGAVGLILPAATRVKPALTPLAAVGLLSIMVLAAAFHGYRGEWSFIGINVVLGGIAAFIAWGRFGRSRIEGRDAQLALQSSTS